jgi:hypothetical protein
MATIRASCPDCGDVELTTRDLTVRVCAADNKGAYLFRCPACTMVVVKDAEQRIVDVLAASGVEVVVWHLPAELGERRAGGKAITHDDLLDFHALLDRDDWFEQLSSITPRG